MELLRAEKIGVTISGKKVLTGVSFSVQEKEIVTIVGDENCGKSVLASAIMGLVPYENGHFFLNGKGIDYYTNINRMKVGLNVVPQRRKFFANMTVRENLVLGGYMHRDQGYIDVELDELYKLFPELLDKEDEKASDLNADEQQLLALARALMSAPRLLVIDDPTSGVSDDVALRIYKILLAMSRQGLSVLILDRGTDASFKISSRVYVMEKGAISLTGTGREMFIAWNKMHGRDVSGMLSKPAPAAKPAAAKAEAVPAGKAVAAKPAPAAKPAAAKAEAVSADKAVADKPAPAAKPAAAKAEAVPADKAVADKPAPAAKPAAAKAETVPADKAVADKPVPEPVKKEKKSSKKTKGREKK